ncbi:MAG TPA: hypothetical protein VF391_03365, partial [Dermatophilaceae bacterium]
PSTSLIRHLLPLFPLTVVLIGGGWQDRPPRWMAWRTGFLILAGLAGQVWWVWALLRFVPPIDYPPQTPDPSGTSRRCRCRCRAGAGAGQAQGQARHERGPTPRVTTS